MKTYIFNSEYEVYIAVAKDLEDAKALISMKYQEAADEFLNQNLTEKQKEARKKYLYLRLKALFKALEESPHVIENGGALIYEHIND